MHGEQYGEKGVKGYSDPWKVHILEKEMSWSLISSAFLENIRQLNTFFLPKSNWQDKSIVQQGLEHSQHDLSLFF